MDARRNRINRRHWRDRGNRRYWRDIGNRTDRRDRSGTDRSNRRGARYGRNRLDRRDRKHWRNRPNRTSRRDTILTAKTAMERIAELEKAMADSVRRFDALSFDLKRVSVATELLAQAVRNIGNAINLMGETLPGEQPINRRNH